MISRWVLSRIGVAAIALALYAGPSAGGETEDVVELPREVAVTLDRARAAGDPRAALAELDRYGGKPHAWIRLARGHALAELSETVPHESPDATRWRREARSAYRGALDLEGDLAEAHRGLARLAVLRRDWPEALEHCGASIDPATADATAALFYAQVAVEADDRRLSRELVRQGTFRFPTDARWRRLDLTLSLRQDRLDAARAGTLDLLAGAPTDVELWRTLAWCEERRGDLDSSLAALEVAASIAPQDADLVLQLAGARLRAGLDAVAFDAIAERLGDPPSPEALASGRLGELALRAALGANRVEAGRRIERAIPSEGRSASVERFALRLAIAANDVAGARGRLEALLATGEDDPAILVWTGRMAEQVGDPAAAEAVYSRVFRTDAAEARTAGLHLARLYVEQDRREEARLVVERYLDEHPHDREVRRFADELAAQRSKARAGASDR